MEDNG
jgi:hypothetical protein